MLHAVAKRAIPCNVVPQAGTQYAGKPPHLGRMFCTCKHAWTKCTEYTNTHLFFFLNYYYYQLDIKSSLTKISTVWQSTASMAVVYMQLKQTHLHYKVYMNFITVIVLTFYLSLSLLLFSLFHFFFHDNSIFT